MGVTEHYHIYLSFSNKKILVAIQHQIKFCFFFFWFLFYFYYFFGGGSWLSFFWGGGQGIDYPNYAPSTVSQKILAQFRFRFVLLFVVV